MQCEVEIFRRLNDVEQKAAVSVNDIETLKKDLPAMEARLDGRLNRIDAWAGRIFWALAVGAVGLIGHLGVYWVKTVRSEPVRQVETYLRASEETHLKEGE